MTAAPGRRPPVPRPPEPRDGGPRWAWAGLVVTAIVGVVLAAVYARSMPILGSRWHLLELLGVWALVWLAGLACLHRLPDRTAVVVVVVLAGVAVRGASLAGTPKLSDDLYRYSWDGQTQLLGIDPYRYTPESPALAPYKGPWLWPDIAGCDRLKRMPGCTRINRPAVRTIYPPVAEAWFTTVFAIGGGMDSRHKLWQSAGLATEAATLALLAALLAQRGRDRRWLALYALCPLPAIEIVNDGHVDGLAVVFMLAAVLALGTGPDRSRWRPWATGALVGAATLTKLYPAALLVPVWAAPGMTWRDRARSGASAVGVVAVGYAPHVGAVGLKVLGYLPGYLKEEDYTTGSRYLLVDLLHLPAHGSEGVIAVVVAVTCAGLLRLRPDPTVGAATLLGVLLLCATPVQPWYGMAILAFAAASGRAGWAWVVAAGYPYFFAVILADPHVVGVGRASYGAGAVLSLTTGALLARRRRARGSAAPGGAWKSRRPVPARS